MPPKTLKSESKEDLPALASDAGGSKKRGRERPPKDDSAPSVDGEGERKGGIEEAFEAVGWMKASIAELGSIIGELQIMFNTFDFITSALFTGYLVTVSMFI